MSPSKNQEILCRVLSMPWIALAALVVFPLLSPLIIPIELETSSYEVFSIPLPGWTIFILAGTLIFGLGLQMFRMKRSAAVWFWLLLAFLLIRITSQSGTPSSLTIGVGTNHLLLVLGASTIFCASIWYLFLMKSRNLLG